MYKRPVCNPLRCFSCPLFFSVFSKPRGSHLLDAPCILSKKALTLGFLRVHCLTSSSLSPKFIIFRWTCSFSTRSFCLQVLHPLWSHFPQCLILHTSLNRETDSEDSSSLLSHVIHRLFLRVFSATRQLLFSHLPSPKLPLGDPHKPMWEKADLLMCQVPARIIPWCRQARPSRTEGGAHRAALGGAVDGQVRGKWCEKRFYFSMGSNRGENIVRHRPGEPMGSWEIHLKAF